MDSCGLVPPQRTKYQQSHSDQNIFLGWFLRTLMYNVTKILVCKIGRKWNSESTFSSFCFSGAYFFDTPQINLKISTFEILRVHKLSLMPSCFAAYLRCEKMSILWKIDKIAATYGPVNSATFAWFVWIALLLGITSRMGFKRPRVRISTLGPLRPKEHQLFRS